MVMVGVVSLKKTEPLLKKNIPLQDPIERAINTMEYVLEHPSRAALRYCFNVYSNYLDKEILIFCIDLHLLGIADELFSVDYESGKALGLISSLKNITKQNLNIAEKFQQFMQVVLETIHYNKLDDEALPRKQRRIQHIKKSLNRWVRVHQIGVEISYDAGRVLDTEANLMSPYYVKKIEIDSKEALDKAKHRYRKKQLLHVANGISLVVGLGEGLVAMALGGLPLMLGVFVIGLPAWIVNYYLFKGAAFSTLKQIVLGGLYKTEDGQRIPESQRWKITATLFSSFTAATCFGFLSFGSGLQAFGSLFFGLSAVAAIGAPPIGLIVLAAGVATVTTVALTTLFYCSMADFIKNKRGQQIKEYLKEIYVDNFWHNAKEQSRIRRLMEVSATSLFLTILTAGSVLVTLSTFGLFMDKTVMILSSTLQLPNKAAHSIALFANFSALPVNAYFYSRSVLIAMNVMKSFLRKVIAPQQTIKQLSTFFRQRRESPVRWVVTLIQKIKFFSLTTCLLGNTYGQGKGGQEPGAINMMSKAAPFLPKKVISELGFLSNSAASAGVNYDAVAAKFKQPDSIITRGGERTPFCIFDKMRQRQALRDQWALSIETRSSRPIPIPGHTIADVHGSYDEALKPIGLLVPLGVQGASVRSEDVVTPKRSAPQVTGVFYPTPPS